MLNQQLKRRPFLIRFTILLMVLVGCSIGPAPKTDIGILDMNRRMVDFKNTKGTKFSISLDTKAEREIKYLHNQIMGPGDQVINLFTWFHKALTELKDDYYNKR